MSHWLEHTPGGRRPNGARDPLVGTLLDDRYLIEERIATGGFGAIYRARPVGDSPGQPGQRLALKILHPHLTDDPNMVARFRREGATLTQLHDPHTVTTLAVGETGDGTLYIAMELLSGESLHDLLRRTGALAWQTAAAIARAVCSSLAEAHALGVVHRDLKPANIHVEARDAGALVVKVIDFGIVKIARGSSIDDGDELTDAGHMIGTCEYMSPEQLVGGACHGASDIYALGVVTYEMLTGHRPFPAVTGPAAMLTAMLTQTPLPPAVHAAIPPELDRIVMRCLEREPCDRFADIRELAEVLDDLLSCDALRDEVTVVRPVLADPTIPDDERTWIQAEPPVTEPPQPVATGSGSRTSRSSEHPAPPRSERTGPILLHSTLPGVPVGRSPVAGLVRPAASQPSMPLARPSPPPWSRPPRNPATLPSAPVLARPARPHGVLWIALAVVVFTAIMLAIVMNASG